LQAYRASILHLEADPSTTDGEAHAFHEDGLLLVEGGRVVACGDYAKLADELGDTPVEDLRGKLIVPGFVDTHIHFPQVDIIAAHGEQLLDWLERHTFPAEAAFADKDHAEEAAEFFVEELLRNGTTSALVFGSVHKGSVEALFAAALKRDMRVIAGKSLMDRNAPPGLTDTVESSRADMQSLIADWHGKGRLGYAVTPRFAISCSDEQLAMAGEVLAEHPDRVDADPPVGEHPRDRRHRQAVPAGQGLSGRLRPLRPGREALGVRPRRPPAGADAFDRLADAGSAIAFCPTSNLFLGSGLFPLETACAHGVKVGIGTDVGAGTTFSILHTLGEAYKVGQLRGEALDPFHALYLATLGGARALGLEDEIGSLERGKIADFLVLDLAATPLLARRLPAARNLEDRLFALTVLGDDRVVERTYVAGVERYRRRRSCPHLAASARP
jgi:guanine deaminase